MITLYGFGRVLPLVHGYTRDLRVQWALEETGLPYRVHGLDHTAGELDSPAFSRISNFNQVPVIDDDGFIVAESAAILIHLAEKAGKLIPTEAESRMRVIQWCFAALTTIEPPLLQILFIDWMRKADVERRAETVQWARRVFDGLERRLADREWIACGDFTAADILLATVLREVRKTDLIDGYPHLKSYYARALARPAWQRTLSLYAERLGATVADIR